MKKGDEGVLGAREIKRRVIKGLGNEADEIMR